jgi:hypothetical protein
MPTKPQTGCLRKSRSTAAFIKEIFLPLAEATQHHTRPYARELAVLEELRKLLLHQAFNGEH